MIIDISLIENKLEKARKIAAGREFSGVGYCRKENGNLVVYDYQNLDYGTPGYSEIKAEVWHSRTWDREDRAFAKVWVHQHPILDWSGTDEGTIQTAPLGGIPAIVRWSASIVFTPNGWIGRVDNHIKKTRLDVEVFPNWSDVNYSEHTLRTPELLWEPHERWAMPKRTQTTWSLENDLRQAEMFETSEELTQTQRTMKFIREKMKKLIYGENDG